MPVLKILSHTSMNLEKRLFFSMVLNLKLDIRLELDTKIWVMKVSKKTISAMSRF